MEVSGGVIGIRTFGVVIEDCDIDEESGIGGRHRKDVDSVRKYVELVVELWKKGIFTLKLTSREI